MDLLLRNADFFFFKNVLLEILVIAGEIGIFSSLYCIHVR